MGSRLLLTSRKHLLFFIFACFQVHATPHTWVQDIEQKLTIVEKEPGSSRANNNRVQPELMDVFCHVCLK